MTIVLVLIAITISCTLIVPDSLDLIPTLGIPTTALTPILVPVTADDALDAPSRHTSILIVFSASIMVLTMAGDDRDAPPGRASIPTASLALEETKKVQRLHV